VAGFTDRNYFLLAVVLYGASTIYSIFLLRKGFRQDNRINYLLLLAAFGIHTFAMMKRGFNFQRCPMNNLYEATLVIAWTIVASYLLVGSFSRLRFLGAFASPFLFAIGVFALMFPLDQRETHAAFVGGWSSLHKALILLSYGAFGLSSVAGLMYLTQEHDLKHRKLRAVLSLLPPIQRLEIVMSRLLTAGFVLLTAGLAAGAVYLKQTRDVYVSGDPEVLYSLFIWFVYLTLLVLHWRFAQRGRRFALGAVGSFVFVMLTFWGIYMLSGLHNPAPGP